MGKKNKKNLYHVDQELWALAEKGMKEAKKAMNLIDDDYSDDSESEKPGDNAIAEKKTGDNGSESDSSEDENGEPGDNEARSGNRNNIDSVLGRNMGRRGAKSKPNTDKTYYTTLRALRWWCCLIGEYESLLVLQDKVPKECPSMNPRTLELFARYKTLLPGTNLSAPDSKGKEKLILDVLNRPIVAKAANGDMLKPAWGGPQSHDTFCAAVKRIHLRIRQVGQFQDQCDECLKIPLADRFKGCNQHPGNPRVRRLGDPTTSVEMIGSKKQNLSDHADHTPDGAQPLMPSEMVRLRAYWTSRESLEDLQSWVIFLVSCRLLLRSNEATGHQTDSKGKITHISGIQLTDDPDTDSINWICSTIQNKVVVRLAFNIKGKSDKGKTQVLTLFPDDVCPLLCPVRHLIVYVYLAKIKKGHLFPTLAELQDPPADGNYVTYLSYETYQSRLTAACTTLFKGRDGHYGTHTARKTGYLLAIWAGASIDEVKQSARHAADSKSAHHYYRDSRALCRLAKDNGKEFHLAPWEPILIINFSMASSLQQSHYRNNPLTLYQVAKDFMETRCNVDPSYAGFSITYCLQSAMVFTREERDAEKLQKFVMAALGCTDPKDSKVVRHLDYIEEYVRTRITQAAEHFSKQHIPSPIRKEKNKKRNSKETRETRETRTPLDTAGLGPSGQLVCVTSRNVLLHDLLDG
jgi:hypothetical protein